MMRYGGEGFLALGYERSLYVIDLRGPRTILRHPCAKRKSGALDSFTVLNWSICGLNGKLFAYYNHPQSPLNCFCRVRLSLVAPLRWYHQRGHPSPQCRPRPRWVVGGPEHPQPIDHRPFVQPDHPHCAGRDDRGGIDSVA